MHCLGASRLGCDCSRAEKYTRNIFRELSSINQVCLVKDSSCGNTGSIRDDLYWTSRKNSSELIELSSINEVRLVKVSSCSNTGSIEMMLTGPLGRTV